MVYFRDKPLYPNCPALTPRHQQSSQTVNNALSVLRFIQQSAKIERGVGTEKKWEWMHVETHVGVRDMTGVCRLPSPTAAAPPLGQWQARRDQPPPPAALNRMSGYGKWIDVYVGQCVAHIPVMADLSACADHAKKAKTFNQAAQQTLG